MKKTSKSTIDRCISFMRKHGTPILYDFIAQSYFYEEKGSFEIGFIPESVNLYQNML